MVAAACAQAAIGHPGSVELVERGLFSPTPRSFCPRDASKTQAELLAELVFPYGLVDEVPQIPLRQDRRLLLTTNSRRAREAGMLSRKMSARAVRTAADARFTRSARRVEGKAKGEGEEEEAEAELGREQRSRSSSCSSATSGGNSSSLGSATSSGSSRGSFTSELTKEASLSPLAPLVPSSLAMGNLDHV